MADTTAVEPPKRLPKGVVLGRDGKPCRSCTSFASWASQAKASIKTASGSAGSAAAAAMAATTAAATASASATAAAGSDCPADVETLGRGTWTLLHTIAAQYPTQPTTGQQADVRSFMGTLSRLYPCWVCAEDFQTYLARSPVRTASRDELGRWLCAAHNEVNQKLGKPAFDCNLWEERWRTGWKDGRCD
ncbi:FAD dependent sulfhydryl oxidase [Grosmannia clavigera kw1407]|uniref:Sulfhydryl oxidase n=1 Tax=Grosmannia clavigera (strain kw1407 / UAMH 11150) TaxID=655863 RepID=F0XNG6_GROCL|nr:FAD dependent sulfhydryl oxidase [Grosmannia clavigera kw1407]EFX00923.1 FAD dependent sulfhydryl oxidase [Grosmannia clavigera kw1407]